jgi:hypothetical protein
MRPLTRSLAALVLVVGIYYVAPIGERQSATRVAIEVVALLVGVFALGWLIVAQIRRQISAGPVEARAEGLLVLLYLVVVVFAAGYLALARSDETQFVGLATKTDSLYFTVSTLATVGFGDVHATGQLARFLVTVQIVFDLVFVAALVTTLSSGIKARIAARRQPPGPPG